MISLLPRGSVRFKPSAGSKSFSEKLLDSYQLYLGQKAQENFFNAWKTPLKRGRRGFLSMKGHSTFSCCLISVPRSAGFSTFDIWNHICVGSSITLGILGTLAHFRHFPGLSGLGGSG